MDKLKLFAIWLDGYIEACGTELNHHQTNVVRNKLNDLFEHEAEPVKLTLEELGEKHGFPTYDEPQDPNNPVMRC